MLVGANINIQVLPLAPPSVCVSVSHTCLDKAAYRNSHSLFYCDVEARTHAKPRHQSRTLSRQQKQSCFPVKTGKGRNKFNHWVSYSEGGKKVKRTHTYKVKHTGTHTYTQTNLNVRLMPLLPNMNGQTAAIWSLSSTQDKSLQLTIRLRIN